MMDEPPTKKACILNTNLCIICFKSLAKGDIIKNPTTDGVSKIIQVAELRQDEVYKKLLPVKEVILTRELHVSFHKSCRARYTSSSNNYMFTGGATADPQHDVAASSSKPSDVRRSARESTSGFNIRSHCFICGESRRKGDKLIQIVTGTGQSTREKVLTAADSRQDTVVRLRMLTHTDLFAFDAKYHRNCYAAYISERNILAARKKAMESNQQEGSSYDDAFNSIIVQLDETVFSQDKTVTHLSKIRADYIQTLVSLGVENAEQYSSWKIKERLQSHYGDQLVFVQRPGLSDLVCACMLTVGDALQKSSLLEESDITLDDLATESTSTKELDEVQVLHRAAGILRHTIGGIKDSEDYISSLNINVDQCGDYVPDLLYDFIRWCVDGHAFKNISSCSQDDDTKKDDLRITALCQGLIGQCQKVRTPIALGLGLQVHHNFGSKRLIEDLNSLGYSVSYDEVRRFLTSVAIDLNDDGVFVPRGIERNAESVVIDAAIDNFDQNEDTLDGKSTTHAMAAVLYKRSPVNPSNCQVPRSSVKSLSTADTFNVDDEIVRYCKPAQRPQPPMVETDATIITEDTTSYKHAKKMDLLWATSRLVVKDGEEQNIPAWSGFNSVLSERDLPLATIRYMPFLRASPSDFSTIYTILTKLAAMANTIGQSHILVTADMAIYSKAQEILWNKPPTLDGKVTMRLGGMHTTMALLAALGKLYGDSGLLALLTDSNVYAVATARQMLQGTQVARGIRGMKIAYEAIFRVFHVSLKCWLNKSNKLTENADVRKKLNDLQHAFTIEDTEISEELIGELLAGYIPGLQDAINLFRETGRQQSATFAFWDDFMSGVQVLLHHLRAERDGNFDLHLNSMCEAIPWFRAAGRHNYAKYVPGYISDMKRLEHVHPQTYQHLLDGGFAVRRSPQYRFNAVSTDQALEQTINKEGKSQGGIIGLTLRKGALNRWLMTRHVTAEFSEAFKTLCNDASDKKRKHGEVGKARIAKDEADVQAVVAVLEQNQNPFDLDTVPQELTNIITGQVASPEVAKSLGGFLDLGKERHNKFMTKRLDEETRSVSFWDPEPRPKVLTFADMHKTVAIGKANKLMVDSEVLFRRLLAVSRQREVDLQLVLQHELAAVPPSLFHDDGNIRKCVKSDLAKKLESTTQELHTLPQIDGSSAYIIDGMALLQSLNEAQFSSFGDLARLILQRIRALLQGPLNIDVVTCVFDRYDAPNSIKYMERLRRGAAPGTTTASHVITENRTVPNYRNFLKNSGNKSALAAFVCSYLEANIPNILADGQILVLAGGYHDGRQAKMIKKTECTPMHNLYSTQEEADTRILLHAVKLAENHRRLIIRCDDTDVLVLLLYYFGQKMLPAFVYMHAGHTGQHTNRERYIPIHDICEQIGERVCKVLPASHALTGCDTTCSLFKIGKKTAYRILVKLVEDLDGLTNVGSSASLDDCLPAARIYALALYGNRKRQNGRLCENLDELRYEFAFKTDKPASAFPPTEDAFKQHVKRANYQVAIWVKSHEPEPVMWSPEGNGWKSDNTGVLNPVFFEKDAAPVEVRDLTHLYCTDSDCCRTNKCHCLASGLHCTEACSCRGTDCINAKPLIDESDDDDSEDGD